MLVKISSKSKLIYSKYILNQRKIEDVLGEDHFGFRRGKGTRDATGMISERTLEIDAEVFVCFIDWQKAYDRVKSTKLMHRLKGTCTEWRERRLISNLYMTQSVKVRLNRGEKSSLKIGRGVRQGCCLSPILTCTENELIFCSHVIVAPIAGAVNYFLVL
jgi:hypothetical protein